MPSVESWQAFAGVGGVIIFLGSVVFGLQRIGLIGQKKQAPAPSPPDAKPATDPSPEAVALIDATRALIDGMRVITERSETMARVHKRLDDVSAELSASTAETARIEGQLGQINKSLHLIHEHLLQK